jgi:hypothetical protein
MEDITSLYFSWALEAVSNINNVNIRQTEYVFFFYGFHISLWFSLINSHWLLVFTFASEPINQFTSKDPSGFTKVSVGGSWKKFSRKFGHE